MFRKVACCLRPQRITSTPCASGSTTRAGGRKTSSVQRAPGTSTRTEKRAACREHPVPQPELHFPQQYGRTAGRRGQPRGPDHGEWRDDGQRVRRDSSADRGTGETALLRLPDPYALRAETGGHDPHRRQQTRHEGRPGHHVPGQTRHGPGPSKATNSS